MAYKISVGKCRFIRHVENITKYKTIARKKYDGKLAFKIYKHNSLIRRKLGNVNLHLQENKAANLAIAAPMVTNILIRPGEIFSFWELVGKCSVKKGYKDGLTIVGNKASSGTGGGLCQFTNLIHWMVLHTDLDIIEHHHHDRLDLFPDYGRTIPFGTGTSIMYNYLDYRFKNCTDITYQLIVYVDEKYLHGEMRADKQQANKYHIKCEEEYFSRQNDIVYRNGKVYRTAIHKESGVVVEKKLIKNNRAVVMYDSSSLKIVEE